MTRAVRSAREHPLRSLLDAGVPVALGSDDRSIFGTSLRGEIAAVVARFGVAEEEIPRLLIQGAEASFTSPAVRLRLTARIRAAASKGFPARPSSS